MKKTKLNNSGKEAVAKQRHRIGVVAKDKEGPKAENPNKIDWWEVLKSFIAPPEGEVQKNFKEHMDRLTDLIDPIHKKWADTIGDEELMGYAMALLDTIQARALKEDSAPDDLFRGGGAKHTWSHLLGGTAAINLAILRNLVLRGNKTAGWELYEAICRSVEQLNDDALKFPSHYQRVAQLNPRWPVLFCPNSTMGTDIAELQEILKVGACQALDLTRNKGGGRSWDIETPANRIAIGFIEFICCIIDKIYWHDSEPIKAPYEEPTEQEWFLKCKTLPLLEKNSVQEWVDHIWEIVLAGTNKHPEAVPWLYELGKSRRNSQPWEPHVRAKIKEVIRDAMQDRLAFHPAIYVYNVRVRFVRSLTEYKVRHADIDKDSFELQMSQIDRDFSLANQPRTVIHTTIMALLTQLLDEDVPLANLHSKMMIAMTNLHKNMEVKDSPKSSQK